MSTSAPDEAKHPPVRADLSAVVAHSRAPDLVPIDAPERPITVDQSNYSVVVDERVVVKWLLPPVPVPHRGERLLTHLREVGFVEMPAFMGAEIEHGHVTAMVTEYIDGALDGWDWMVDELTASPTDALVSAERIGVVAARLHEALATPSKVFAEPVVEGSIEPEVERGLALLDEALACTAGDAGKRLAGRVTQIRAAIHSLSEVGLLPVQPTHGDLHVGQFLRSDDLLLVNDFDGNPIAEPAERDRLRSTLTDLASLLQSIDHVGRIVVKRNPERADEVETWIHAATQRAYTAYTATWPEGAAHPDTAVILRGLSAIQELHEFVYAARSLPRWLYVPDAALSALFPLPDTAE